jgi:hypothetical protein
MKYKTLEERTCINEFNSAFTGSKWVRKPYKTNTVLNYNEYNYFYNMVREVLFDTGDELKDSIILNLFYDITPDQFTYDFSVCSDANAQTFRKYSLLIDSIILHIYSTGVGLLSFHLNNRSEEQKEPDDILRINQAGRRLYPPYFGLDKEITGTQSQFECRDFSFGLDMVKTKELASEFSLFSETNREDFDKYRNPDNFASNPFRIPLHFQWLFQGIPLTVDKADMKLPGKKIFLSPLLDDRMFVLCWYGNNEISDRLKERKGMKTDGSKKLAFENDDWWYKFVFNDQKDATCQNQNMAEHLIINHTYERWSDYGTFYGINRYSFVCLTGTMDSLKEKNAAFLVNHMQTMYYKISELCLVQRACLIRFSDEVSGISAMKDDPKAPLTIGVSNLYQQYLRFVNRIYFREVTAQEQGIEMYNLLQEHMKIENNVKDLDREIQELHNYTTMLQLQKQNRNIELLTLIGTLFIFPSFISGFFGMNFFSSGTHAHYGFWRILLFLTPIILPAIGILILIKYQQRHKGGYNRNSIVLLILGATIGLITMIGFFMQMF